MTRRGTALLVALALLGVGTALAIGLAANAISGDTIGLSARPLRAGDELAPPQARDDRRRGRGRDDTRTTTTTTTTSPSTTTTPTITTEAGDEHGGRSRGGSGGSGGGRGRGRGRGGGEDD